MPLKKPSVMTIYEQYLWLEEGHELGEQLYGAPPKAFGEELDCIKKVKDEYSQMGWHTEERMKKLARTLRRLNRELGCLTPKVAKNIEELRNGAIEAAHQSVVLGGPVFILNKAATAERIAAFNSAENNEIVPFFCVADYDIVQNELTHMRTPLMGSGGTIISIPVPEGFEHSPVSRVPLPDFDWYLSAEESIRAGYAPLFKVLNGHGKTLFEERLEECFLILRSAFVNSSTLGEWATRVLGMLFNMIGDLGLPLLVASDPEVREVWADGMEMLLEKDIRRRFLEAHKAVTSMISDEGFETGIGERKDDYVPFYYECQNELCHASRTELFHIDSGSKGILKGKCPSCNETIEIEYDKASPDLSEIAHYLSPRVDTRQIIVDTSIPVLAHVGGPGETAYYAQVIPVAKELQIPFPAYVKYPRVYYNTPWSERLAKELADKDIPILHDGELFKPLGKAARFRKKSRIDEMNEQLALLGKVIDQKRDAVERYLSDLERRIRESDKPTENEKILKLDIERYLSWSFGKYAEGKVSQESAWAWIDWAINSGFSDLFGPYQRAYTLGMKHGAKYFVNFVT